ncbi:MAG: hypothetical protein ABIP53_10240, partial [Candidatus Limnocylindrales bacterium]
TVGLRNQLRTLDIHGYEIQVPVGSPSQMDTVDFAPLAPTLGVREETSTQPVAQEELYHTSDRHMLAAARYFHVTGVNVLTDNG